MRPLLLITLICGAAALTAPARAQDRDPATGPAPTTAPDGRPPSTVSVTSNGGVGEAGPGVDSAHAVNPAPGAPGPYVGHPAAFYDTEARVDRVEQRVRAALRGGPQRRALAAVRSIRTEIATQKARHGALRDWDREHVNQRLDHLEAQYGLGGAGR